MTIQSTSTQMCSSITGYNSVTVVNATQTSTVHANFLVAPAMVIAWNTQDLAALTSSDSVTIIPFATNQPSTTGSNDMHKVDAVRHKVILAICVVVACLVGLGIVAALTAFILVRKRQHKHKAAGAAQDLPPAYAARSSQSSDELPMYVVGSEPAKADVK